MKYSVCAILALACLLGACDHDSGSGASNNGGGGPGGGDTGDTWTGTDPDKLVSTPSGKSYDLRHGTPDSNGTTYVNNFNDTHGNYVGTYTYDKSISRFGGLFTNANCALHSTGNALCGATIKAPNADVLAAWKSGWTGKGVNILIGDTFGKQVSWSGKQSLDPHAAVIAMTAANTAWGAELYGMNFDTPDTVYNSGNSPVSRGEKINFGVFNIGFDFDLGSNIQICTKWGIFGKCAETTPVTDPAKWAIGQLTGLRDHFRDDSNRIVNIANGEIPNSNMTLSDAVITKSAGDFDLKKNGVYFDAQYQPLTYFLAHNTATASRLLIVGALDKSGTTRDRATIRNTSAVAGKDALTQARFLVASGEMPFDPTTVAYDGKVVGDISGTDMASARVAGYAAIIRQKFPNLQADQVANILLQTARYDTLSCYPKCNTAIYGAGEASLSHALSPAGKLK